MKYDLMPFGVHSPVSAQSCAVMIEQTCLAEAKGNAFSYRTRARALRKALKALPGEVTHLESAMRDELSQLEKHL